RSSGFAVTYSQNYLEQGRYAEAVASTGAEADLVEQGVPDVTFTDVTKSVLPARALAPAAGGTVALADQFGTGRLDLIDADASGIHVYRNVSGRFTDATQEVGLAGAAGGTPAGGAPTGIVAGDYDNDGRPDLFVLRERGYT